jgi:hypothetical protein
MLASRQLLQNSGQSYYEGTFSSSPSTWWTVYSNSLVWLSAFSLVGPIGIEGNLWRSLQAATHFVAQRHTFESVINILAEICPLPGIPASIGAK